MANSAILNNLTSIPTQVQPATVSGRYLTSIEGQVERAIDDRAASIASTKVLSFPTDTPKYYILLLQHDWALRNNANGRIFLERAYRLPLPSSLTDAHNVNYDGNFNWFSLFDRVPGGSIISNAAGGLGQAFSAATGMSVNQFKAVTLRAPEFRTYAFEWKLAPKDFQEASNIKDMHFEIKKGMTPPLVAARSVMQFPKIFWLAFYPNSKWLFKFKPAVITSCQINYQGGNPSPLFYKSGPEGGPPESIILRLTFLELEYWISSNGQDPGDFKDTNNPLDAANWYSSVDMERTYPEIYNLGELGQVVNNVNQSTVYGGTIVTPNGLAPPGYRYMQDPATGEIKLVPLTPQR